MCFRCFLCKRVKRMYEILDKIKEPKDVKALSEKELIKLAAEIREYLIESVSKTGGHLASNLGVVELTLALFKTLNLPQDAIVWDVGHQTYVHKLLTGRKEQFGSLRQFGGLSGFPKTSESIYDVYNSGHSSTSVSVALGMTKASDLLGEEKKTVAVIGDGALTGGVAFEAFNDAGAYPDNFIVILNDNEMSIAKNVGGISHYLTRLRTRPSYFRFKADVEKGLRKIPVIGEKLVLIAKKIKDGVRHILSQKTLFENLGFTYLGPIDGHNLSFLCRVLSQATKIRGPVLIHAITKKGKGYEPAEAKPTAFHGVGSFQVETGECTKSGMSYSAVFGKKLTELAKDDSRICAITAAMPDGTGLSAFSKAFPDRFFDVGIAEQHAVTFASGLAKNGMKPVLAVYSSFLQRAYDEILHDVCLQNANVVFCIDRAGIVGEDGETHQGLYDLSYLNHMPNMTVLAPANEAELEEMLTYAVKEHQGPIAIRYPRGCPQLSYEGAAPFMPGKADVVTSGKDVCIFSVGHMLPIGAEVVENLAQKGIFASLVNVRSARPLDETLIHQATGAHPLLVTLEDGIRVGGVGEQIKLISKKEAVLVKAHDNGIVPHGARAELYRVCGLDAETISHEITELLKQVKRS